jgi:pimeloyl-ACP methyl ester carboxylesterase
MHKRLLYLHGFASAPTSRKARFFADHLLAAGRILEIPDLTGGNFETLTIGGQLAVVESLLQGESATLIGSSMGGYLAALYASRHAEVERVILLAPAFGFAQHWTATFGTAALERWRESGFLPVFHYGEQRMRQLRYGIVEESCRWEAEPAFDQPAHIFHGTQDTVVPFGISERYVALHPHVVLTRVDSDHELGSALEQIWAECRAELIS